MGAGAGAGAGADVRAGVGTDVRATVGAVVRAGDAVSRGGVFVDACEGIGSTSIGAAAVGTASAAGFTSANSFVLTLDDVATSVANSVVELRQPKNPANPTTNAAAQPPAKYTHNGCDRVGLANVVEADMVVDSGNWPIRVVAPAPATGKGVEIGNGVDTGTLEIAAL